jgi:hypothetical protein
MFPYLRICVIILALTLPIIACKKNKSIPSSLSVSPAIDTIGGTVTITGAGFSINPIDNIVLFNDSSAGVVLTATSTQLTVVVPGYVTEGRITVKTKDMQWQTAEVFKIAPKFSPQHEATGYPITIVTGGGPNLSDYNISFNGTPAQPTKLINDVLTVPVPAGANNGKITVTFKGKPYTSFQDFTLTPVGTVSALTSQGAFSTPTGLAIDQNNNLFVADLQAGVIDKVDPVSGSVVVYAGNGSYNFAGGSPLLSAGIYGALNLGFHPNGDLYATNQWYGPIFKITADSAIYLFPAGQFFSTDGLYIDAAGNIYLTDAKQIKKITPGNTVSVLAGSTQGFQNGPASTALFLNPTSLVSDEQGNLFISDDNMIRLLSNGSVSTFAGGGGNGEYVDGIGLSAGFLNINSIARDPATGNIFATEPANHVVRMISPTGVVTTIAGSPGQQGYQNGTGPAALFEGPWGIAVDKNGEIYVSDGSYANSNIRKIQLH